MGIEDIQISEELETNAPSIKYRGDEGPKSPQEMEQMMMAQLEEEYAKYVFEMQEQGIEPMSMQQFIEQAMAEGQMSGGQPLPSDPTKPVNPFQPKPTGPVLPDRQMAAFGGIMGMDGRRQYGIGSKFKKFVRKVIPNEVADIAVKAAPFVAMIPGQQGTAALMRGIGRFDQTGSMSDAFKQGALTYGFGKVASPLTSKIPGIGTDYSGLKGIMQFGRDAGSSLQGGYNALKTKLAPAKLNKSSGVGRNIYQQMGGGADMAQVATKPSFLEGITSKISGLIPESTLGKIALGGGAVALGTALLGGGPQEVESAIMERGEGLDLDSIRLEVREAFKDETGEKLLALRNKYPYLGTQASKDVANMAMGGRIGYGLGNLVKGSAGVFQPTSASMNAGDASSFEGGSGMGGMIADLIRKNPQMFSGAQNNSPVNQNTSRGGMFSKFFSNPRMYDKDFIDENFNYIDDREEAAMGGRIGFAEGGGIMDLGGMEKDYRAEGGFVPIGRKEKADDVPARLSVNEFVFTADAVRNAGGGDIDKGAEVMENMMKHLEQGGQVSDESQGMAGAQQMFETSERLSEVI